MRRTIIAIVRTYKLLNCFDQVASVPGGLSPSEEAKMMENKSTIY